MPKMSAPLTVNDIRAAQKRVTETEKTEILRDGQVPGLSLRIGVVRSTWALEYKTKGGKNRSLSLGFLADCPLQEARKIAARERRKVQDGRDPFVERKVLVTGNTDALATMQLYAAIDQFVDLRKPGWSSGTLAAYESDVRHIKAHLPDVPLPIVTRDNLELYLKGIIDTAEAQGEAGVSKAQRIANFLAGLWRQASVGTKKHPGWGWPVDRAVAFALHVPGAADQIGRSRVLNANEIRQVWAALNTAQNIGIGRDPLRILRLSLITGLRIGGIAGMRVGDIDLSPPDLDAFFDTEPRWSLVARDGSKARARDRAAETRIVLPLCSLAVQEIEAALSLVGTDDPAAPLFAGHKGKPIASNTVSKAWALLRENKLVPADVTAHDLRRTMRTMLDDIRHPGSDEDCERLIGHSIGGKIQKTYSHGKNLNRMRPVLNAWDAVLAQIVRDGNTNVVPLDSARV